MPIRLLSVVLLLTVPRLGLAQAFDAVHGVNNERFNDWVSTLDKKGLRPAFVSAADDKGTPIYNGIALENAGRHRWVARHGLSGEQFQKLFDELTDKGFRLTCIGGYRSGDAVRFLGIWVKDDSRVEWRSRHGLSSAEYQKTFKKLVGEGFRLQQVSGYPTSTGPHFAAIFVKDGVDDWVARHDLTEKQYQELFETFGPKKFHPTSITAYPTKEGTRFAALFVKGLGNPAWSARHNLSGEEYQKVFNDQTKKGFRPSQTCAYPWEGKIRFAGVFVKGETESSAALPMSGKRVPELDVFDDALQKFMGERHITGGTLAVSKGGTLLLARGYGWSDRERMSLMGPSAILRIASVSKPITLAALLKLIREGKLKLTDSVVAILNLRPVPGQEMDPRWKDITIEHLIKHQGGFDRDASFDPMFRSVEIAKALGKPSPALQRDIIQHMLGRRLDFAPGSKTAYSNFGYCLLGRVIEKASGKSYGDYVREQVMAPIGVKNVFVGRSLPGDRHPGEPVYLHPGLVRNVFDPAGEKVRDPDGGFCLEAMDAHGGLIMSAPDLVRFLEKHWIDGQPRKAGESKGFSFFGSLPGTWTMALQRADGVNIAALFNQRTDPSGLGYEPIRDVMNRAADKAFGK